MYSVHRTYNYMYVHCRVYMPYNVDARDVKSSLIRSRCAPTHDISIGYHCCHLARDYHTSGVMVAWHGVGVRKSVCDVKGDYVIGDVLYLVDDN